MTHYIVEAEGLATRGIEGDTLVDAVRKFCDVERVAVTRIIASGSSHLTIQVSRGDGLSVPFKVSVKEEEHEPTSRRIQGFTEANYEVTTNGSKLWVNGPDGMCLARFGRLGIDIHATADQQLQNGISCIQCTHGTPTEEDWMSFRTTLEEVYGVHVPEAYRPSWLAKNPAAQAAN